MHGGVYIYLTRLLNFLPFHSFFLFIIHVIIVFKIPSNTYSKECIIKLKKVCVMLVDRPCQYNLESLFIDKNENHHFYFKKMYSLHQNYGVKYFNTN